MRVEDKSITKKNPAQSGRMERAAKVSPIQRSFQDVFQEKMPASWQESLELLLNKLEEAGQRLVKTFSIYDLIEYKDTLRSFLNDSLKKAFGLKEEMSYFRGGRPKIYQYIEVIDQELEDLSKLVLAQQKDSVKVLKKLDSIRGLLVDLYY